MTAGAAPGRVLVMGAGSVGCYVGGALQAAGVEVGLVARPRIQSALREHGLTLTDLDGARHRLEPAVLDLRDEPGGAAALVLLCVKSGATADAARQLAGRLAPGTLVLSLQNGVANAELGAQAAPQLVWLAGMVAFNVAEQSPGHFHRGTSGELAAQDHPALRAWLPHFRAAGLPLTLHADLQAVQWGKLLLNLNNPVNALSGLPLRAQLLDRDHRAVFAALMDEGLAALRAAGIRPQRLAPLPPRFMPALLRLPTWVFRLVASRTLRIDAKARTSMADDLALGRTTEVDAICGAVLRLARRHGLAAPRNEAMVALLSAPRPGTMSGAALRAALAV